MQAVGTANHYVKDLVKG